MSQDKNKSKWIWYPDDFELYHSFLLHNRREVNGLYYYPMWELNDFHKNMRVYKIATITKKETFKAISNCDNLEVLVNGVRYKPNELITLEPGKIFIKLSGYSENAFPCFYAFGDTFASDETWSCACFGNEDVHCATNDMYVSPNDNPCVFKFKYKNIKPKNVTNIKDGTLYDFGKEYMGKIIIDNYDNTEIGISLYYGESKEEALDINNCTLSEHTTLKTGKNVFKSRAIRFLYVKTNVSNYSISLDYEYYPTNKIGNFSCSDKLINKVWKTCAHTLSLNTREGFFDGIKRDRWVWGGDAYQSIFANAYLTDDFDCVRRTLTILRGTQISQHINTIIDYSAYWIMSLYEYYKFSGDKKFIISSYPKAFALFDLFNATMDEHGFTYGSKKRGDWTFIDWADIDKTGCVCAEQMLLYRAYICMSELSKVYGDDKYNYYLEKAKSLKDNINKMYWDKEKGAYIDSFESGKRNVTRHANILALLFNVADTQKKKSIIKNVIYNEKIPAITTPYFKFFELDALCSLGDNKMLFNMLHSYWGKMIEFGATSIWEQFDPTKSYIENLSMYGKNYGNSLCHAWGASPIYLLGKYCLGVSPTSVGYKTFEIKPNSLGLKNIKGIVPIGNRGQVCINIKDNTISIVSNVSGGTLIVNNQKFDIQKDQKLIAKLNNL